MVRWSDFGSDAAFQYNAIALAILEDVILCTDTKCTTDHSNDIDNFYDFLIVAFTEGTRDFKLKIPKISCLYLAGTSTVNCITPRPGRLFWSGYEVVKLGMEMNMRR